MPAGTVALALGVTTALAAAPLALGAAPARSDPPPHPPVARYAWPVHGPVLRPFEAPGSPYGPGHRGIDIGAPAGTPVRAAAAGIVAFAGTVAGERYVSIDHPDGIRTTYSWLAEIRARGGDWVAGGEVIGVTGNGHPDGPSPHLHLGARIGAAYLDPLLLLGIPRGRVHLAPLPAVERGGHP